MKAPSPVVSVELFGGPAVQGPQGEIRLSPFQAAFLTLVFAEGPISRPDVARILWRSEASPRVRQRIRQLRHGIRQRLGVSVIEADADLLAPGPAVPTDLRTYFRDVEDGRLVDAATRLIRGFAPRPLSGLSPEFDDWRKAFDAHLRGTLSRIADDRWDASSRTAERSVARDAAEASYLLVVDDASIVARVIEARASAGKMQAAEVAYAEYIAEVGAGGTPEPLVEGVISRVRQLHEASGEKRGLTVPHFVGRKAALTELGKTIDEVESGVFSFAVIAGEAGIGKTRVLSEARRIAHLQGVRCLSAQSVELERNISLNPILDALEEIELEPHLSALGDPWRTVIGAMLPSGYLTEPVGALPPIEERSLSRRLLDAFSLLFERLAAEEPTILFLDDLQWADATTVAALQFMQRRWHESRFGVVAAVRPDLVGERSPLGAYLSGEAKLPVRRIDLEELSEAEARELVGFFADDRIDEEVTQKLFALAGHHPLYVTELARDYLAGRLRLPDSPADEIDIPISLKQILSSRSEGLSEVASRIGALLAVRSKPMRINDLTQVLELSLDIAADAVEELGTGGLVEVDRDRVWITHDLFRSAIYAELSEARRAVLHLQLASHLIDGGDEVAGELAGHFERGGEAALSAEFGWKAAERALEGGAVAEAAHFFELVTRNEADEVRRAQATALLATSLYLNRDIRRANPALELASSRLNAAGMPEQARRMEIRRVEGLAETDGCSVESLVERLNVIKSEARASIDWESVAMALDVQLQLLQLDEQIERASGLSSEFRDVITVGSSTAQAIAHIGLAVGLMLTDPAAAMRSGKTAVTLAVGEAGALRLKALNRLLIVLVQRGLVQRSENEAYVSEAELLARSSGDLMQRFVFESNVGVAHLDAGDLDRAEVQFDRAASLLGSAEMAFPRVNLACNRGELSLARGDYHLAAEAFQQVERLAGAPQFARDVANAGLGLCALQLGGIGEARRREEDLSMPPVIWYYDPTVIFLFRSKLLERRGRLSESIQLLDEVSHQLRGRLVMGWLKIRLIHARLLVKSGRPEAAEIVDEALRVTQDLGLEYRQAQFAALRNP